MVEDFSARQTSVGFTIGEFINGFPVILGWYYVTGAVTVVTGQLQVR
jgi:heme O synthase-like polyprenyltransferase